MWEIGGGKNALFGVWMTWGLIEGTGRSSREEGEPKQIGQKCFRRKVQGDPHQTLTTRTLPSPFPKKLERKVDLESHYYTW